MLLFQQQDALLNLQEPKQEANGTVLQSLRLVASHIFGPATGFRRTVNRLRMPSVLALCCTNTACVLVRVCPVDRLLYLETLDERPRFSLSRDARAVDMGTHCCSLLRPPFCSRLMSCWPQSLEIPHTGPSSLFRHHSLYSQCLACTGCTGHRARCEAMNHNKQEAAALYIIYI